MQAAPTENINEYDFSALEEIQPKGFNMAEAFKELLFYTLPLISFGFFLLILFSAVMPSIQNIVDQNNAITALKKQDAALKQRINAIELLANKNAQTDEVLQKIDTIIPTGRTEVVKFGERIDATVASHFLVSTSRKTGETVLVTNNTPVTSTGSQTVVNDPTSLPLSEIPTKFDIKGSYDDIRQFFSDLYKGQDFFVVDKMDLTSAGNDTWNGNVSLVKYQFSPSANFDPVQAFLGISEATPLNQQVLDFLQQKFINNVFENAVTPTPTPTITPTP